MASVATARAAAGWVDPAPDRPVPFWESVRLDILAHIPEELRGGPAPVRALKRLRVVVESSGFRVVFLHRVAHQLHHRLGLPGRAASGLIGWLLRHGYGCMIAPTARLHAALILPHPQNLVIGPGTVIGPHSWVFQNVTSGGVPGRVGLPRIGQAARIYPGAVLVGPIVVGDNVMIGANAVVDADVPARHIVRCHPPDYDPLPDHLLA